MSSYTYRSESIRFKVEKIPGGQKGGGPLAGTLYIASLITPPNPIFTVGRNVDFVLNGLQSTGIKNILLLFPLKATISSSQ